MGLFKSIVKVIFGNAKDKPSSYNTEPNRRFEISSGNPEKAWNENQDIVHGLQFAATMQLRTPLRVLKRHGEIHSDIHTKPEQIAKEMWEGIWLPKLATWRELGIDEDEMDESTIASNIGQIKASEYLPFLISVREIVETNESIDSRINMMRKKPMTGIWKTYVVKHGGIDEIINQFFPRFINTIPKLNKTTIDELSRLGIFTANKLEAASDSSLMSINGIGKAKLKSMRDYCASITKNRDDDRLDNVTR
jgi:hypothetical protein